MKRMPFSMVTHVFVVLCFVSVLGCSSDSNEDFSHLLKGAFLEQPAGENHPPILHVTGSHYEMGFQQGYLLADRIAESFSCIFSFVAYKYHRDKTGEWEVLNKIQLQEIYELIIKRSKSIFLNVISNKTPELEKEIRGMADGLAAKGSSFGFDDIVAMAALLDVMNNPMFSNLFFQLNDEIAQMPVSTKACSGFVAWGSATFGGKAIHGANQDMPTFGVLNHQTVITVAKPDKGNAFVQVSFPGWFLMSGMNEAGLSTNEMASASSDMNLIENPEIPHTLHMRMLVQYASNLKEAEGIIRTYGGTTGWNILVMDSSTKTAVDIEGSATQMGPVYPWDDPSTPSINENQGLCVTNQYMSCDGFRGYSGKNLTRDQMEFYGEDTSSWGTGDEYRMNWETYTSAKESWDRWSRLWDLYDSNYGSISVDDVIAFMSDTKEGAHGGIISCASEDIKLFDGVPVPHIKGPDRDISLQTLASLYSCVFDPESNQKGIIWVAVGAKPAQKGKFYPIDFEEELNKIK